MARTKLSNRVIEILDVYAFSCTKAIIKTKYGITLYEGAALNTPYEICKRYSSDHYYDVETETITIEVM